MPIVLVLATTVSCESPTSVTGAASTSISPAFATLALGQELKFASTTSVEAATWDIAEGRDHGVITPEGTYTAPLQVPADRRATVRVTTSAGVATAIVSLRREGPYAADCRGSRQDHLPRFGEYVYADELPTAIFAPRPEYPLAARIRGIQGDVLVFALVCRSGQVIDTRMVLSHPLFDAAATAAARRWVFTPARVQGDPVAVWIGIPMRFTLP